MKIYVTDEPMPASAELLATAAGCEIHHIAPGSDPATWPRRLAELGVNTLGLTELPDPEPPPPAPLPNDPIDELVAAGTITETEAEIIRALRA